MKEALSVVNGVGSLRERDEELLSQMALRNLNREHQSYSRLPGWTELPDSNVVVSVNGSEELQEARLVILDSLISRVSHPDTLPVLLRNSPPETLDRLYRVITTNRLGIYSLDSFDFIPNIYTISMVGLADPSIFALNVSLYFLANVSVPGVISLVEGVEGVGVVEDSNVIPRSNSGLFGRVALGNRLVVAGALGIFSIGGTLCFGYFVSPQPLFGLVIDNGLISTTVNVPSVSVTQDVRLEDISTSFAALSGTFFSLIRSIFFRGR